MPEWFTHPSTPQGNESAGAKDSRWNSFDSLTVNRVGDNRFNVKIGYLDKDGKVEYRTFEGTREEIHKDIAAQKDLPANEREHLLRSLDIPNAEFPIGFPGVHFTPDGRVIWGFPNMDITL